MSSSELVKLYYRIGEVASIVGVQPHVLRYWETEFRTIRPQKSHKGQRVYSRKDVEKLLRVKDLLKNQGFTIAGAKRRLREPDPMPQAEVLAEASAEALPTAGAAQPQPASSAPSVASAAEGPATRGAPEVRLSPGRAASELPLRAPPGVDAARMRHALLTLREDIVSMLDDIDRAPRRPKLPSLP